MHYRLVQRSLDVKLRGTNQQTNNGLWHLNGLISGRALANEENPTGSQGAQRRVSGYSLNYTRLHNRSSAVAAMGVGGRLPNYLWGAGLWTNTTTTFTDDTTDWQDTGTNDFAMGVDAANDSGFVVWSEVPFNAVSINVGTASSGGAQVGGVYYSLGTGSWSAVMANLFDQSGLSTFYPTGENLIVFAQPAAWGKTTGAEGTNIPVGKYAIKVATTTAPTVAALGTSAEVWIMLGIQEAVADNGLTEMAPADSIALPYVDALGGYISVITATQSMGTVSFSPGTPMGGA